jgi:hypothetical protein
VVWASVHEMTPESTDANRGSMISLCDNFSDGG